MAITLYEFFCKTSVFEIAFQRNRQLPSPESCLADMLQLFSQGAMLECSSEKATEIFTCKALTPIQQVNDARRSRR